MIGIDNITKITNLVVDVFNQGVTSFSDGVQGLDFLQFIDEGAAIGAASKSWKELPAEIKDLTPAETDIIVKNIQARLNVPNPLAKAIVTDALVVLAGGSRLYFSIKAARDAKKAA